VTLRGAVEGERGEGG